VSDGFELDPKFIGGVDMVRRTGSIAFQIRYSDDEEPTVWVAVATHNISADGMPAPREMGGEIQHTAAGGLTPLSAVLRLCDLSSTAASARIAAGRRRSITG